MYGIQNATFGRRFAAFIIDGILLSIIFVGLAFIISKATQYERYPDKIDEIRITYAKEYGFDDISFSPYSKKYEELSEEDKTKYSEAYLAFSKDSRYLDLSMKMFRLSTIFILVAFFVAYLIVDFIIPLLFKNGQTIGKKLFGICLVKKNGVKIDNIVLFARTIVGKYAIETAFVALQLILLYFGTAGIINFAVVVILLIVQMLLLCINKNHMVLHDILAYTVVVDMSTQIIFDSEEEMLMKKKEEAKEKARREAY